MNNISLIDNTLKVICNCWNEAENTIQTRIKDQNPGTGEEFITQYFHGELQKALDNASKKKKIETAFIQDLKAVSPHSYEWEKTSKGIAKGLIAEVTLAEVTLHSQKTEAKTGGDLGFVISRPQLSIHNPYSSAAKLSIAKDYRIGLLTQAKLKNKKNKWNKFTKTQKNELPKHLKYLALLLYEYKDPNRRILEKFKWQLCAGFSFTTVENWLASDAIPDPLDSCQIIKKLGNAIIGTDVDKTINEVICPPKNRILTIHIHWPPGGDPPSSIVRIYSEQEMKAEPVYQ